MSWKVVSIDNKSHTIVVSKDNERVSLTIPMEHRTSTELKQAYIKSVTEAHDAAKVQAAADLAVAQAAAQAIEAAKPVKVKRPWHLFAIIIAEALAIALLLMRK